MWLVLEEVAGPGGLGQRTELLSSAAGGRLGVVGACGCCQDRLKDVAGPGGLGRRTALLALQRAWPWVEDAEAQEVQGCPGAGGLA